MLAVVVAPRGFTTAQMSEASIVPRASHRRIAPAACLGRVLGAEPQVRCRVFGSHSYSYNFVSHPPLRTVLATFTAHGSPVDRKFPGQPIDFRSSHLAPTFHPFLSACFPFPCTWFS